MKNLKQKLQEEIAYAKDRMLTYDENNQKSNSDVEQGIARGLNMALDFIKEEKAELRSKVNSGLATDEELTKVNEELEWSANQEHKLEEDLTIEENL